MKKFTKLMLTFALLVCGVGGVNAKKYYADLSTAGATGNASWTAGTNTFAWTAGSYAFMAIPGGSFSGDLSEYTTIGLTVSDIVNEFRVDILANGKTFCGKSISTNGKIVLDIFSDFTKQWAADKITIEDLKSVTAVRLNTNSASGSVVVTDFYIGKPAKLLFDETGTAELDFSDLVATGGLSFNEKTGVLTSDGTGGTLYINMPSDGIDFSNMTALIVNRIGEGDDFINDLLIKDTKNDISHGFYSSKYNVNFTTGDGMKFNTATNVNSVVWNAKSTAGTMTISSIVFKANVITCTLPGTPVPLNTLQYYNMNGTSATTIWQVGESTDTYYGSGSSDPTNYVDLTGYEELRIHRDDNTGFRAFFINAGGTGTNNINNNTTSTVSWNETEKYWVIDLSKVEKYNGKIYLNTIKSESFGLKNIVNNITVYKTPVNAPNYILAGKGTLTPAAETALADANATYIDATGITAATALPTANPNCLIVANAGKVTNDNNVIVDGVCANLELTDEKPFKAPAAFTATAAKFTKTVTDAGYATMVIPFAVATLPEGVEAFDLTAVNGETITSSSVDAIAANSPVMIKADAATYEFTATGASIAATADGVVANGLLNGTYATTTAAAGAANYVLQKNGDDVNFYLVTGTPATVKPFRAYLTAPTNARALSFDFNTTGVNHVKVNSENAEVYNLNGQRVAAPQKGLYIVNGKKVIVK